jgi:hypothetical protein
MFFEAPGFALSVGLLLEGIFCYWFILKKSDIRQSTLDIKKPSAKP